MTLIEWREHFRKMFSRRNDVFLPGMEKRLLYLLRVQKRFHDSVRKGWPKETVESNLADIFGFTMALANSVSAMPLGEAFAFKWGERECGYCQKSTCTCLANRSRRDYKDFNPVDYLHHPACAIQSLDSLQADLMKIYGEKNRQAGLEACLSRLTDEIAELSELIVDAPLKDYQPGEVEVLFALEISDIVAWTMTLAGMLDISLEAVIAKKYWPFCPGCKKKVCECGPYVVMEAFQASALFAKAYTATVE